MKKQLLLFLCLSLVPFGSAFLFAQAQKLKNDETQAAARTNPAATVSARAGSVPENSPRIKEHITPPPLPVMHHSGNAEKDAADYAAEKEKWINDVLALYRHFYKNRISPEQENKLKEMLKKENLDEVMKGRILINENELQNK